jgi:hypothetical protein
MSENPTDNKPDLIAYALDDKSEVVSWEGVGVAWKNSKGGVKLIINEPAESNQYLLLPRKPKSEDGTPVAS